MTRYWSTAPRIAIPMATATRSLGAADGADEGVEPVFPVEADAVQASRVSKSRLVISACDPSDDGSQQVSTFTPAITVSASTKCR